MSAAPTMIDTHSHLLPGLDHGCPDLPTSVAMAREAWAAGIQTIVCTPHFYDWDPDLIEEGRTATQRVRAALLEEGIGLRLLLGFEIDLIVAADADEGMLESLAVEGTTAALPDENSTPGHSAGDGGATPGHVPGAGDGGAGDLTGAGKGAAGGVIIIETPFHGWPPFMEQLMFRLSSRGYLPVLAHPERNERVQRNPDLLSGCLRAGAVAQGTAGSLSDMFRSSSMRTFLELLSRGDLGLLASDAHAHERYTWSLAPVLDELRKKVPQEYLEMLVATNPERLLAGRRPLPAPATRPAGRSRWRR